MNDTKSMTQSMPIAGNEYVAELLNILEANNMPGAKDLLTVVNQISAMEKQYANILTQLSVMREELAEAQRQNHPIKAALQKAVIVMQAQAVELRDNLNGLKREIINCCKNAVTAFKEHGLSALRNIAEYIKIRPEELMTMDELTTMPGDKCILQLRGLRPFLSPKYDLRKHPNFKHTAEANKKNDFDISKLTKRRLTLNPDEVYTVIDVDGTGADTEDDDILDYSDLDDPDEYA